MKLTKYLNESTVIAQIVPIYLYEGNKVIKARDLHEALESKQDFYNWSQKVIEKNFQIIEMATSVDISTNYPKVVSVEVMKYTIKSNTFGIKDKVDYLLDIDVAKHIAMLSKTEKGKIIREYFIEIEKQYIEMLEIERNIALTEVEKAQHRSRLDKRNSEYNKKVNHQLRKENEELTNRLIKAETEYSKIRNDYNDLVEYYYDVVPREENIITLEVHGFSVNSMYEYVIDKYSKKPRPIKSKQYNKWINNFLNECARKEINREGINFTKPVGVWMYFDHKKNMDVTNYAKTLIDALCKYWGVDDKMVQIMACRTNSYIDNYSDGQIHIALKNINIDIENNN